MSPLTSTFLNHRPCLRLRNDWQTFAWKVLTPVSKGHPFPLKMILSFRFPARHILLQFNNCREQPLSFSMSDNTVMIFFCQLFVNELNSNINPTQIFKISPSKEKTTTLICHMKLPTNSYISYYLCSTSDLLRQQRTVISGGFCCPTATSHPGGRRPRKWLQTHGLSPPSEND